MEKEFCEKCRAELLDREAYIRVVEERKKKIERGTKKKFIISIILEVIFGLIFLLGLTLFVPPPLIAVGAVIWILAGWGICAAIQNKGKSKLVAADRGIAYRKPFVFAASAAPAASGAPIAPAAFGKTSETGRAGSPVVSTEPESPGSRLKMAKNLYRNELPKDSINFYEYLDVNTEAVWKCKNCDTENSMKDMYCIVCGSQRE